MKKSSLPKQKSPLWGIILAFLLLGWGMYLVFSSPSSNQKPVWNDTERVISSMKTQTGKSETTVAPSTLSKEISSGSEAPLKVSLATGSVISSSQKNTSGSTSEQKISAPQASSGSFEFSMLTGEKLLTGSVTYWNEALWYGFSLPKWAYYSWEGSRDGAAHSVAVKMGTGVTTFEEADVRIWFYPSKILPELEDGNAIYQDRTTPFTFVRIGSGCVRIEWDPKSIAVKTIVDTLNRR